MCTTLYQSYYTNSGQSVYIDKDHQVLYGGGPKCQTYVQQIKDGGRPPSLKNDKFRSLEVIRNGAV